MCLGINLHRYRGTKDYCIIKFVLKVLWNNVIQVVDKWLSPGTVLLEAMGLGGQYSINVNLYSRVLRIFEYFCVYMREIVFV